MKTGGSFGPNIQGDDSWIGRSACAGRDPEMFDLLAEGSSRGALTTDNRFAQLICVHCPVLGACHADAERRGDWGVIRAGIPRRSHTVSYAGEYRAFQRYARWVCAA